MRFYAKTASLMILSANIERKANGNKEEIYNINNVHLHK